MDASAAADLLAGAGSALWEVFWDNKLYIPLGLVVVGAYFQLGR